MTLALYCSCGKRLEMKSPPLVEREWILKSWKLFHSAAGCRTVDASEYRKLFPHTSRTTRTKISKV